MSHDYYLNKFSSLNVNTSNGKKSPHKVCMLLTVMDLIQAGNLSENKIEFNTVLKDRFTHYFDKFAQGNDRNRPENPYFHLRSEGFWHLVYNDGYDEQNTKSYSQKAVSYAYVDDELFNYMRSYIVSNELKESLVSNLSNLSSLFHQWLLDLGKSEKTAINYLGAIRGSISNWMIEKGIISEALTEIKSYHLFVNFENQARQLQEFQVRDAKGNGMYSSALSHYHKFLADLSQVDIDADIRHVLSDKKLTETEKTILVNTRMGQGHFRAKLVDMWRGCAVTKYNNTQMLVASHIKPWRDANNQERLDKYNGLLLIANLDKAFDLGFISFDDNGKVLISKYLERPDVLGLNEDMSFNVMTEHKKYLGYHRGVLFKGL